MKLDLGLEAREAVAAHTAVPGRAVRRQVVVVRRLLAAAAARPAARRVRAGGARHGPRLVHPPQQRVVTRTIRVEVNIHFHM